MNQQLETQVLIIGGGVTGTGLARDLALRGVGCLLVEKQDINAGASGGTHGLLHSGARYILSDPASARECRDEGSIIKRLAPQCVEETGGLFVAVEGRWMGFFVLQPWVDHNPRDKTSPWTLVFDANTWTAIGPQPAPPRDRALGYTLDVPSPLSGQ